MTLPVLGTLESLPALDRPDLLGPTVAAALADWPGASEIAVATIDPELADTAACAEAYSLPLDSGANCVVVAGKRDGQERVAACLVRADTRADVNNLVKRTLDVRKASFLPWTGPSRSRHGVRRDHAGRSAGRVAAAPRPPGGGDRRRGDRLRRTAVQAAGARGLLAELPGAEVIDDLAGPLAN